MFEEIAEAMFGPIGLIAVLVFGAVGTKGGRRLTRKATREVIKVGCSLQEKSTEAMSAMRQEVNELVEEAKSEQHKHGKPSAKAKSSAH